MKPISLKVQAFGPFLEEQTIDFAALEESGVFLIDGKTGAGKTTILDAICFALYEVPSGGDRGSFFDMRCKNADSDKETFVEFEFENKGTVYRFRRSVSATGKQSQSCEKKKGETYSPYGKQLKTTVTDTAAEIIGLDQNQFRQVIILPQGQSEKLLTCKSEDKEKVLNKLFLTSRWESIVKRVQEKVKALEDKLAEQMMEISATLEKHGCVTLEGLETQYNALSEEYSKNEEECRKTKKSAAAAAEAHTAAVALSGKFEHLDKLKANFDALQAEVDGQKDEDARIARAKTALAIEPFRTALSQRGSALDSANKAVAAAKTDLAESREAFSEKQAAFSAHEEGSEENRSDAERIVLLDSKKALYEELPTLTAAEKSAAAALSSAEKATEKAQRSFETKKAEWTAANEEQMELSLRKNAAYEQYRAGICASLAKQLVAGKACPVCGNTVHPKPAVSDSEPVTEEEINRLNKLLKAADEKIEAASLEKEAAEAALKTAENALNEAKTGYAKAQTALAAKQKECIEGISTLAELNTQRNRLSAKVAEYNALSESLRKELNEASSKVDSANAVLTKANTSLETAQSEFEAALSEWGEKLFEQGFPSEEEYRAAYIPQEELTARIENQKTLEGRYKGAKAAFETEDEKLKSETRPDVDSLKAESDKLSEQLNSQTEKSGVLKNKCDTLKETLKDLGGKKEKYNKEKAEADANRLFCKLISAHGGGMSLPRFVICSMLNAVIGRANVMLEKIMSGRYRLFRTDEATSGRKSGLELGIIDSLNGGTRSVKSLSGGEKFLVSLCFAIAVSSIVQEQGKGVSMDAMFVDEGFGTLDPDRTDDALRILGEVSESHALVGVISHVDALGDSITTKVNVVSNPETGVSTISQ